MRWPAIIALAVAVAALAVANWSARGTSEESPAVTSEYRLGTAPEWWPRAASEESPAVTADPISAAYSSIQGDTWFCAGGVGGTGGSRQQVAILNTSDDELRGTVRLFPAVPLGGWSQQWPSSTVEVVVEPATRLDFDPLATAIQLAPELAGFAEVFVAAEVRLHTPGGIVAHEVATPAGGDASLCITTASPEWHFAAASTRRDARARLSLLNPFSDDAVVDLSFAADDGARQPVAYQGVVVPANALVVLDLGSEVTRRQQVAFSVLARNGNVLASILQSFNGELGLSGVSLRAGVPTGAEQWLFPLGTAGASSGAVNSFVVYNPGSAEARVDLTVELDATLGARGVPPFELTVPPGRRIEVFFGPPAETGAHPLSGNSVVEAATRVVASERYWVSVRSFNGVPVVSERVLSLEAGNALQEVSILAGRAASARRGTFLLTDAEEDRDQPALDHVARNLVAIVNPSLETISSVSLQALTGAGWGSLDELSDVEIRPRQRLLLDLSNRLPSDSLLLHFSASEPLVVSGARAGGVGALEAVPELESVAQLDRLLF